MASFSVPRPLLRGHLHLAGAVLAPVGLAILLILAETPRGYIGGAVFGFGLLILYSASAANHLAPAGPRMRAMLQRMDHAAIFIFIAAAYTPFCLVFSPAWAAGMLATVWILAIAGAAMRVAWAGMPRLLAVACYLAIGWVGVAALGETGRVFHPAAMALVIGSGVVFSLGAMVYGLRRPDPFPRVFGYHEVFHACVVAGTALLYAAVAGFVVAA